MRVLKVYAEVLPTTLGRAMYRINGAIKRYAPSWATFTKERGEADLQILDVIGKGSLDFLYCEKVIILQHCYLTAEADSKNLWNTLFEKSKLVVSYMDLPRLAGTNDFNFYRMPWGIDPVTFNGFPSPKKDIDILSTGYVASTESIQEAYDAVRKVGGSILNIGANFNFGLGFYSLENISEELLRRLYERSKYVIGLRKMEGFELPILEGLACGTRGICYNADHYSHWFGNLVEYVEEDPASLHGAPYSAEVTDAIYKILMAPYRPVTEIERVYVKHRFSWENIMKGFWERVEEVV